MDSKIELLYEPCMHVSYTDDTELHFVLNVGDKVKIQYWDYGFNNTTEIVGAIQDITEKYLVLFVKDDDVLIDLNRVETILPC